MSVKSSETVNILDINGFTPTTASLSWGRLGSQVKTSQDALGSRGNEDDAWECTSCNKTFTDQNSSVVICDYCDSYVCAKCAKLSNAEYKILAKRDDLFWSCKLCITPMKALLQSKQHQPETENCCQSMMNKISEKIAELEMKIEEKLGQMKTELLDSVKTSVKSTFAETAAWGLEQTEEQLKE